MLEEVYNLEDALLVGGFVNTLLRNSDRVRVACLAQLVNVIAPLVTNETGVLRQSTYYPYSWALRYARGRVLDLRVESEMYRISAAGLQADFARDASVPFVDLVATIDDGAGQAAVLVLNRDLDGEREVVLEWQDVVPTRVLACETLTGRRFEGRQHVRRAPARRAAAARSAGGGQPDDVQAAAALVHRGASGHQGVAEDVQGGTRAAVIFDLDGDGDLDIVTNEFNAAPMVLASNLSEKEAAALPRGQTHGDDVQSRRPRRDRQGDGGRGDLHQSLRRQLRVPLTQPVSAVPRARRRRGGGQHRGPVAVRKETDRPRADHDECNHRGARAVTE